MKAEFKHTEHGVVIDITAFSASEKTQLSEFMASREKAHKGRLKLLKVTDKTSQLRIGMIQIINKKYLDSSFTQPALSDEYTHWRLLSSSKDQTRVFAVLSYSADNPGKKLEVNILKYANNTFESVLATRQCSTVGSLERFMISYK
jgi:hypothetical protein